VVSSREERVFVVFMELVQRVLTDKVYLSCDYHDFLWNRKLLREYLVMVS
jgi:hypothetical protein